MPLPTNPEQERVARRLAEHRGVTVQGPGTGKTHTIANLIRPDSGRVRAMCAQGSGKAKSSSPPERCPGVNLLLRKRRIGDLNPGGP